MRRSGHRKPKRDAIEHKRSQFLRDANAKGRTLVHATEPPVSSSRQKVDEDHLAQEQHPQMRQENPMERTILETEPTASVAYVGGREVVVTDIRLRFRSIMALMIKVVGALICVCAIIFLIVLVVVGLTLGILSGAPQKVLLFLSQTLLL